MTREEAIEIDFQLSCKCPSWADQTLERIRQASTTQIDSYIALGMLKLDETKPRQTLWELLRKHGIALDKAQAVCNDAMLSGVSVPTNGCPQDTEVQS